MTTSSSGKDNPSRPPHFKAIDKQQLSTLVDMESPEAVHEEVIQILCLINPAFEVKKVDRVFRFTVDLYEGCLQDYQACNTDYHNLRHITDTYLAMARLLHGARISGEEFSDRELYLGLTGALMHDAGMIQHANDTEGTGAKYTQDHVKLSMDFVAKHAADLAIGGQGITDLQNIIQCTDLTADIALIDFSSPALVHLGKILATADLIAQMADRTYLEKLLYLFHEFREAEMGDYENEVEFLKQTLNFFDVSRNRFTETLDNKSRYMMSHFKSRWNIDENLYVVSIENQREFLNKILADENTSIYKELKRRNIVQEVRRKFGKTGLGE